MPPKRITAFSPSVVGGDGELEITVEQVGQDAEVVHAAEDVLTRVVDVAHRHAFGRFGNELHQPAGVRRRDAWGS